jgi:hypothetical protein
MKMCWHDWGKWSEPIDTAHDYKKVQVRYCTKCHKAQVSKVRQPFNLWFSAASLLTSKEPK